MYIDRPSNEGQIPLLNDFHLIQPSLESSLVADLQAAPGAADFLTVPAQDMSRRGSTAKAKTPAWAGKFLTGADTGARDDSTGPAMKNPQTSHQKNGGQNPEDDARKSSPGSVNSAKAGPSSYVQGDQQVDLQGGAPADKPLASSPPQPPYPSQRDARLKRPIAKQSGPVTDEGKAAVSSNALKHGGYAMPTRGDESFASIEQSLHGRLEPMGEEQRSLVRSIGYEIWRIGNIERTVVELERDIDHEKVSLSQLAAQLDFPFAECYRDVMLAYRSEDSLRVRVHGHLCGEFRHMLDRAGSLDNGAASYIAAPNARAKSLINRGHEVLARQHLEQNLEDEFFEEFDAVMLDARLGRSSLHPRQDEQMRAGWLLPLVECWVYRNFRQIRITEYRLQASLRLDLMTNPRIERALKSATARLGLLLSDYRDCRPDISSHRLQMLGYGPSRAAP